MQCFIKEHANLKQQIYREIMAKEAAAVIIFESLVGLGIHNGIELILN